MATYRVWMRDDYVFIVQAESRAVAARLAIKRAKDNCVGVAMTPEERKDAITVDFVRKLS